MMVRKLVLSAAAASLATLPIGVYAATPQPRVPAEMSGQDEQIVGMLWQYIILPVLIAVVLAAVSGGDDEDSPTSP